MVAHEGAKRVNPGVNEQKVEYPIKYNDKKKNCIVKMKQLQYLVIILYVISVFDMRTNAQSTVLSNSRHYPRRKKEPLTFKTVQRTFPSQRGASDVYELYFGVLLPEKVHDNGCTFNAALPAMELAIRKLQQPGGLLEDFTIFVEYRDTKSTSTYGSLAAYDLYTKQSPGINDFNPSQFRTKEERQTLKW